MHRVKNVIGSSRYPCPSGYRSWLDYWESKTGQYASICSAEGCYGHDLVGAHVQKVNSYDNSWYIVPLCTRCNQRTDSFEVNATLVPVPSNL